MFYNTGIATYIWVLSNRKPGRRKGKVQLIDATEWFKPLRKNLGKKNCELSEEDIQLRHLFNWAIAEGCVNTTPFRRQGVAVVKFASESPRRRRLEGDEEQRLL